MRSLILHPNRLALWHALLNEAQQSSSIILPSDLEAYLVFLLMRYTNNPHLASSILGLEFLEGIQHLDTSLSSHLLKEVGDKCLLFSGLFPGRALKKSVKLSYFVKLGQTAYSTLSQYDLAQEELFITLCLEFPKMMEVLQASRQTSHEATDLLQSLTLFNPLPPNP